jgi:NADH-quinone oxidoreductase subunit D
MHRGAEKLFESRDYRQIVMLANRHDWLSAFGSELGVVLAVERLLRLEVPVRAVWLRTMLAELSRLAAHLAFLAALPPETGVLVGAGAGALREQVQDLLEGVAGGRVHYMFNRVGGVLQDLPADWPDAAGDTLAAAEPVLRQLGELFAGPDFVARTRGLGRLDPTTAAGYGVSGVPARAAGLPLDLRLADPYLAYPALEVRPAVRPEGDAGARVRCLLDECRESIRLVRRCLAELHRMPGPVNVRLPKVVRAPEGAVYAWTENPLGINGYYLVSRGMPSPWRLKLRSGSFNNVQALRAILPGTSVADLVTVLASMFFVVGDVDR